MTLEEYVCSLHLAQKLKKRDVPQDSRFCWVEHPYGLDQVIERTSATKDYIAAYCDEDIFDLCPTYYNIGGVDYSFDIEETPEGFKAYFTDGTNILENHIIIEKTRADAWARGLLYLLDLRILNPEDLHRYP